MECHQQLTDSIEDQLSLASVHYLRSHYQVHPCTDLHQPLVGRRLKPDADLHYVQLCSLWRKAWPSNALTLQS